MYRLVTHGLWVLGLTVVVTVPALAQEGWGDAAWWQQATPAAVQARLDRGAAVTARTSAGETPLHGAARSAANPVVVALLVDRGADLTVRDARGETPLHAAVTNDNLAVATLLLNRGPHVNVRRVGDKKYLFVGQYDSTYPVAFWARANIDAQDAQGKTPLHWAASSSRNPAVTALLLDRGTDVTLRDNQNKLPADYAAENKALRGTEVYQRLTAANF